jgi:2-C-methyl-D-erythritol 4-phosphate cytidylyltransferase
MGAQVPKQYLEINGRCLLQYSLEALLACPSVESVTVALHPDDSRAAGIALLADPRVQTTAGGAERADSVLAGLLDLAGRVADSAWVLVHDAARPCLPVEDVERLVAAVSRSGRGGILAQPLVDTIKRAGPDGLIETTVDRDQLWRAQTPQLFQLGQLRQALQQALERHLPVTDEASAMELAGHPVQLVPGSPANLKVTVPEDLALASWYLARRSPEGEDN